MELQPGGCSTAILQKLRGQQLQKFGDRTENTVKTHLFKVMSDQYLSKTLGIYYLLSQFFLLRASNICVNIKRTSCGEKKHKSAFKF